MKSCCFWQAKFRYSCWLCDILNKRYRIDMYRHGLSSSIQSVLRDGDVLISDPDRKRMKTRWAKSTRDELSKPVSSRGDLSWTNLQFPLVFCGCANCSSVIWIYLEGFPIQFTARRESSEICPMEVLLHQRYTTQDFRSRFLIQLRRPIATNITSPMSDRNLDIKRLQKGVNGEVIR